MRERDYSQRIATGVVDDAVGKLSQRKTAPAVFPEGAQVRAGAEKRQLPFVLQDKRKTDFSIGFPGVKDGTIKKLPIGFRADRRDHPIAARALAMESAAGISLARPLSISSMRRSTSADQASSIF